MEAPPRRQVRPRRAPVLLRAGELARRVRLRLWRPVGSEAGRPPPPRRPGGLAVSTPPQWRRRPEALAGLPFASPGRASARRSEAAYEPARVPVKAGPVRGVAARQLCVADQEGLFPVCRSLAWRGRGGPPPSSQGLGAQRRSGLRDFGAS